MELLKLTEKAMTYSRKIKPASYERFSLVDTADCVENVNDDFSDYIIGSTLKKKKSKWKLYLFTFIMCIVMCFTACKILLEHNDLVGGELMSVIENLFTPKDFGKIKFVDTNAGDNESEALSYASSFSLPFNACTSTALGETFILESPSEITVKCAMEGVVESINVDSETNKKTVVVKHKHNLKSEYLYLDNVSVEVGNEVKKNTILGLAFSYQVGFKITYKDSLVKGLEIINGELSFY